MTVNFQFQALKQELFSNYFTMNDSELREVGAYLFTSDEYPCYPCRVSLTDAAVGETVLAISYEHHAVQSPYRSSGPIFVRSDVEQAKPGVNEVPDMLRHRLHSIRGYSRLNTMVEAETAMGVDLDRVLIEIFSNDSVEYIHIHNAGPGCFNCAVTRT